MMLKIREKYEKFFNQKGQDLVEYALLLAIVVGIGYLIYNQSGIKTDLQNIWSNAATVTSSASEMSNLSGNQDNKQDTKQDTN